MENKSENNVVNNNKNNNDNKNSLFIIILLLIVAILIFFFPKIYRYIESLKMPKIDKTTEVQEKENKEVEQDVLESIHYPLMRNSIYNPNTYYSLDKFTISDMSNSDILLNAFLDIYEGNMTAFEGKGNCTIISKQFNVDYIKLRIKNILGKNIKYTLEDFYVPEDSNSDYKGTWVYDSAHYRYLYNGLCTSNITQTRYYDLTKLIKVEYDNNDIIAKYYVGFAKVEGNSYIIYSDPEMQTQVSSGNINSDNELNSIFENLDTKKLKIYKYTFKDTLCSYNDYCLYQGEWVSEF